MRSSGPVGALRRHVVLMLLATLAVCGATYWTFERTPVVYVARGSVLLVAPEARSPQQGPVNSLLLLSDLQLTRGVVLESLNAQAVADTVEEVAPGATYEVVPDPMSEAPILILTTEAATKDEASLALRSLIGSIQPRLNRIQNSLKISRRDRVVAQRLTFESNGTVSRESQVRASVVVAGLGISLALAVIVAIDARRRRRWADVQMGGVEGRSAGGEPGDR